MWDVVNNKWLKNIFYVFSYVFLITTSMSCIFSETSVEETLTFCESVADDESIEEREHGPEGEFEHLFAGGHGTEEFPFLICTVEQLQNMNADPILLNDYFELAGNIDATETAEAFGENDFGEEGFVPIGYCIGYCYSGGNEAPFTGSFNGNGFTIFGLLINSDKRGIGLFSIVDSGAVITNVKFSNVAILARPSGLLNGQPTYSSVGTLAGYVLDTDGISADNSPVIDKVHVDYACVGSYSRCYDYFYSDAYPYATIPKYVGGIVGYISGYISGGSSAISQTSVDNAFIYGTDVAGGIVGYSNYNYMSLSQVSARGYIYGGSYAGGILGRSDSDNIGDTVIQDAYFAGATGALFQPDFHAPYDPITGRVTSPNSAGGIVGKSNRITIKRVYLGEDVHVLTAGTGTDAASGIIAKAGNPRGLNNEDIEFYIHIENSFSAGVAAAPYSGNVSGVVGYNDNYPADAFGILSAYIYGAPIANNWFVNHLTPTSYAGKCAFNSNTTYNFGYTLESVCEEELAGFTGFFSDEHAVYDVGGGSEQWEFVDGENPDAPWIAPSEGNLPKLNFD